MGSMTLEQVMAKWEPLGFEVQITWWKHNREARLSVVDWRKWPFRMHDAQMAVQKKKHLTPEELDALDRSLSVQYFGVMQ